MAVPDVSARALPELWSLAGRRAVVTGGARGIGRAIAERFAEAGAALVLGDLDLPAAEAAAAALAARHGRPAHALAVEVADAASVAALADAALDRLGGLDVWVNNAGIYPSAPALEIDAAEWDRVIAVNVDGLFLCSRIAARGMKQKGGGSIVNLASIMGFSGGLYPNPAYQTSKGAVVNLTRALALEFAADNIRVNAIAPTFVRTRLTKPIFDNPETLKNVMSHTPLGRLPGTDDIAAAILFLASPAANCITGVILPVDSGYLAR